MRLGTRLMLFFLGSLAAVLIGFSGSLDWLASKYLNRQIDDRLEAAIHTLVAAAEVTPEGVEWEPAERSLKFNRRTLEGQLFWRVRDPWNRQLDGSPPDGATDDLQIEDFPLSLHGRTVTVHDRSGRPWRAMKLNLSASGPASPSLYEEDSGHNGKYRYLSIAAGLSLEGVEATLHNLRLVLAALSIGLWTCALIGGRWLCRRAIRPLTEMAEAAHAIGGNRPEGRLPVPPTDDEIGELGRSFNALLDRLQESFECQQRFTGDASHQLRTPLTVIQGNIDLALRQPRTEEEYRRVLSLVGRKAHLMTRIVESLLFLARADAESERPRLELIELGCWIKEYLQAHQEGRSADIRLEIADACEYRVNAQPSLLAELVSNLLDNAAKYSEPGMPIIVRLGQAEGAVALAVEDRGIGIAKEEISHLFEAFYRSPAARQGRTSGLGLGLSIAARLARAFGGRLNVESRPGQGSTFTLILPAEESDNP